VSKDLAELLFPDVYKTPNDYLKMYPERKLVPGAEVLRFAPSPTGFLHIGNFYSVFNQYLAVKKAGGVLYMRLEDTDSKREKTGTGEAIYQGILSYGIVPDEGYCGDSLPEKGNYGPYMQSKRIEIYKAFAKDIVVRGNAFPCFCKKSESKHEILERREKELDENDGIAEKDCCRGLTFQQIKEKLAGGQRFALRLKSKGDGIKSRKIHDLFKGEREIKENAKDIVLLKQDGIPPYSLASIVDDILMRTTKIIRGEEWYPSFPAHLEVFEAMGLMPLQYGHAPVICTVDAATGNKRKLSKRLDAHADMRFYALAGYPRESVLEYLLTLANSDFELWRIANPNKSFLEFDFSLGKIGSNNPMFDLQKLDHISKNIIARKTCKEISQEVAVFFKGKDIDLEKVYKILCIDRETPKPRKDIAKYSDIPVLYDYLFKSSAKANKTSKGYCKIYNHSDTKEEWFSRIKAATTDVREYTKQIRLALTGKENTPDLYAIMQILGEAEVIKRLAGK